MRYSSKFLTLFLLILCASPSWAQLLKGTVTDSDDVPLPGVQITMSTDQGSFREVHITDDKGVFKQRFLRAHGRLTFELLFEKPGYQSFTQEFSPTVTRMMNERWSMEKALTKVVESHGNLSSVVTGSSNAAIEAFNAGLKAQREGDLGAAAMKLQAAVDADETLGPAHVALAQVLLDQKKYPEAIATADKALELGASRPDALRVKYQALRASGKSAEAEAISAELDSAEDAVASARRFYNEGGEAFQLEDHDTALVKFRKAAELDPTLTDAHHAVATLELAKGNYEASVESAKRAIAAGSEDISTLRVLYDAYSALGKVDELAEIAPRLAGVDPDFGGQKLVEQAADMWNAGQTDRAVALSKQALAIDPSIAKAHYFIGLDHLSGGRSAEAKSALQKFVDMAPEDPDAATAKEMLSYL